MADVKQEQARLDELEQHIEQAEEKAKDLLEPRATVDGGPRGAEGDPPIDEERVKPGTPAIGESEDRFEPPS